MLAARHGETIQLVALRHAALLSAPAGAIVVDGDIARPDLGLAPRTYDALRRMTTAVLHCAAVTRFSVDRTAAARVNVDGTRHVLAFASEAPRLRRFGHVSTAFVAGRRTGAIGEDELEHDAGFVNAYEWSKYEAERLVRATDLPWAVYRVSTMIGRAATGQVRQWSAVHQAIRFYYHGLAPMLAGRPETPVDVIPDEFAAGALVYLFDAFEPRRTYHLCAGSANALPLAELLALTTEALNAARPAWRSRAIEAPAIVDGATFELFGRSARETGNQTFTQVYEAMRHFVPQLLYPKEFDQYRATRALGGTGIAAPPVASYLPRIVDYCLRTAWGSRDPARGPEKVAAGR